MTKKFKLNIQLTEYGKKGDYSLTATTSVPNTCYKAEKLELLDKKSKLLGLQDDVEIILNMSGSPLHGLQDLHDLSINWIEKKVELGVSWKRVIIHLVLDGKSYLDTVIYSDDVQFKAEELVQSKKQKLSELTDTVEILESGGIDSTVKLLKQKQKGC